MDTRTDLAASASSIVQGNPLTLTATVTPSEAAGTVQFKDGAMNLDGPVPVINSTAAIATSISSAGQHQLLAEFTPVDAAKFNPSRSSVLLLSVIAGPK